MQSCEWDCVVCVWVCVGAEAQFEYINKWGALIAIQLCMRAMSHAQWKSIERFSAAAVAEARAGTRHRVWLSTGISTWESSISWDRRRPSTYSSNQEKYVFCPVWWEFSGHFSHNFRVAHSLLFPQVNHQLLFANFTMLPSLCVNAVLWFLIERLCWLIITERQQGTFMTWSSIGGNLSLGRLAFFIIAN